LLVWEALRQLTAQEIEHIAHAEHFPMTALTHELHVLQLLAYLGRFAYATVKGSKSRQWRAFTFAILVGSKCDDVVNPAVKPNA
jgi:hypothetical protein